MNTFEKVVHKAIHKQALNSAVRDLSADDLIVLKRNPNLIDAEVLEKIRAEIEQYQADCNLTNSDEIDCKFCDSITFDTIYRIIDKYRNEVSE